MLFCAWYNFCVGSSYKFCIHVWFVMVKVERKKKSGVQHLTSYEAKWSTTYVNTDCYPIYTFMHTYVWRKMRWFQVFLLVRLPISNHNLFMAFHSSESVFIQLCTMFLVHFLIVTVCCRHYCTLCDYPKSNAAHIHTCGRAGVSLHSMQFSFAVCRLRCCCFFLSFFIITG